jgi:hypothetical protein
MLSEEIHFLTDLEWHHFCQVLLHHQVVDIICQCLPGNVFLLQTGKDVIDVIIDHLIHDTAIAAVPRLSILFECNVDRLDQIL